MRILVCTTPIRQVPTDFPPFGALAVIQSLRRDGWDPRFYDIDGLRPPFEEVERFVAEFQPDVVAISAVVSTAYAYTKRLSAMIKRVAPRARVIVGGNLAASAEILHRLAAVDFCVIGEGELVARNLLRHLAEDPDQDRDACSRIPGITYLDRNGDLRFTGYERPLPAAELLDVDFGVLEKHSRIENFIGDPSSRPDFRQDPRTHEPRRQGRKLANLITSKGCVGRCTFCHRWDKGYRAIPVERIMQHVRYLKDRHDVGFFMFADENFGSDPRQLQAFISSIKAEDVLYGVGGVRVRSVTPQILRDLRDSGCVAVYYGMETGSPDMLEVMDKRASQQDNENAARWTREAGLYTIYQLVLGMPGETEKTIRETTEFCKRATESLDDPPIERLSINYIQALPGTPVYEFARHHGLIGRTLREEERYLLAISDINASDETKFLNLTTHDFLTVQSWRRRILLEVTHHYRRTHRLPRPILKILFPRRARTGRAAESSSDLPFNLQRGLGYDLISAYCYPFGRTLILLWLLRQEFRRSSWTVFWSRLKQHLLSRPRPQPAPADYRSLRRLMHESRPEPMTPSETAMAALREGR
ncbi:MAG: radical SAM protein [Elusimicrobia bacterium]|nr:radical SAM protein [Elusimicrobiota bacterium]